MPARNRPHASPCGSCRVESTEGLLHFANPAYYGFFSAFEGYRLQDLPHFYVAWFSLAEELRPPIGSPARHPVRSASC